jgi:hypothetical protein
VSHRWTPALASTTALVILAATGGMVPSAATIGGPPQRATVYLMPSAPHQPGDPEAAVAEVADVVAAPGVVAAPDVAPRTGTRTGPAQGTAEWSRIRLVQSSSRQDALDRYAGEIPSYVNAGPLALVGLAFDHPVAGPFSLSSAFGWRMNPTDVGPAAQFHIGLDYAVVCGTPVLAAADGTVVSAGERGTGGLRIDIDHGDGLVTTYRHNSRLLVAPGDRVGRGDLISLSGTTGNSTGCHLHFDATLDGQYVDPVQLLPEVTGQPRALDAAELERIRSAARPAAPAVSPERAEAAPRAEEHGPVARPATPRTEGSTPGRQAAGAPAREGKAQRPQNPTPSQRPAPPDASPARPAPKPSEPAKPERETPGKPAPGQPAPKPSGDTKPGRPTPDRPTPKPPGNTEPGTPAATDPKEPVTPARPTPRPSEPSKPQPSEPSKPQPSEPSKPQPSEPATPAPSEPGTPEPTEPAPTVPAKPQPTQPTKPPTPEPSQPTAPKAPESLTDEEAARWCLPLDQDAEEETPDFSEIFAGDFAVLVGLVAVLDEEGDPETATEETLIEVSPSALWLESLPACSDAEFIEAALTARSDG